LVAALNIVSREEATGRLVLLSREEDRASWLPL